MPELPEVEAARALIEERALGREIVAVDATGALEIVEGNLDECVLCRLCIDAAPEGSVTVRKLYDDGATL